MAQQVKDIHISKCLEELRKKAEVSSLEKTSAKLILTSADKLFAKAEETHLEGDEELTYLYYFRYVDAISVAQKKEDFKKDKAYYEKLISKKRFRSAVTELERLTNSLQKRYALLKDIEVSESAAKLKEYNDALENTNKTKPTPKSDDGSRTKSAGDSIKSTLSSLNGIVRANGVDKVGVQNGGISPQELKNLLEQKTKRVLLVDCRFSYDFAANHISHSNCICIPATVLSQGMSANTILKALHDHNPESYMGWHKRGSFDYIILYDWNSSFDHRQPGLNIVYDALTQWDQDCKNAKILVVQGGMKTMYYTYPNLLTNPQTGVGGSSKLNGNGSSSDLADLRKLESISYPDLDDNPPKPKPPKPMSAPQSVDTNVTNNARSFSSANSVISNNFPQPSPELNSTFDGHGVPKTSSGMVSVDRSTKPTRFSSALKIPNGPTSDQNLPSVNHSDEVLASSDKTDVKVAEYSQALDDVIESSKKVVESEKEVSDLREMLRNQHRDDEDLKNKLSAKEAENERLKLLVDKRNEQLVNMRTQYEAILREQKAKHILPRIRTPAEEEKITAKQLEKEKLDEMVKELRKLKVRDVDSQKKDESVRPEEQRSSDNVSKLPPIPSNSSSSSQKINSGTGTTQLPMRALVINNASLPGPTLPNQTPVPAVVKPSSSITPATVNSSISRPTSQDSSGITRHKLKDERDDVPRSSALKRSHSHPNIAQSHEEDLSDDLPSGSQPPRVNRGLKPSGHRSNVSEVHTTPRRFARNFEIVSSTENSKTGLKNLGNTCYMNSIIQCLSHTNKLVDYLRNEDYTKEWHPQRSSTKGEATDELAAAVKQMHSGHRSIALRDLKACIGKHHSSFKGFEQQDSHEFITILLDWLHEEMNRVPEKTPLKEQKNDGLSDEVAAARVWEDYKRSNNSKISDLFCGIQKSCLTCANCSRQSVTFEPFFILSVPIPSSGKKCDIQQCIDFYTTEEELTGWGCVHCKRKVRATKKIDLWRLPPYLIIHLQRFYYDGYWKKRLTEIDFPVENLNLNQKVLERDCNDKCPSYDYQLYGVSNHYGTMDSGHYTAYCRIPGHGNWWKFDDQEVCPINSRDVPTAAAYILFYQNRNYR